MHMRVILQSDKLHKRDCKCSDLTLLLFREGKLGYFASYYWWSDGCVETSIVQPIKWLLLEETRDIRNAQTKPWNLTYLHKNYYVIPASRWLYSLIWVWFHWGNSEDIFFKYFLPPAIQTGIIHHHQHNTHQWIMSWPISVLRIETVASILLRMYFISSAVHFI